MRLLHDLVHAVREIGSARTSVYSNFVPIVAMLTAVIVLHEPLGCRKILGAAAVLAGVALTRVSRPEIGRSASGVAPDRALLGAESCRHRSLVSPR